MLIVHRMERERSPKADVGMSRRKENSIFSLEETKALVEELIEAHGEARPEGIRKSARA